MVRETSDAVLRGVALAALVAVIAAFAGCGGDDSDSATSSAGSEQAAGAQLPAAPADIEDFGEEASPEDRDAAGSAVEEFLRAQADGDSAAACSVMSASTKQNLELFLEGASAKSVKNTCTELVDILRSQIPAKRLPQANSIDVTSVRIEGERGFVLYRDPRGTESAFPVVREGSAWKVAAIAGQSLP
jgi:hypothetical protein